MTLPLVTLAVIVGMLLAETRLSRRHEELLQQRGAVRPPGDVYAVMALAYPLGFVAMGIEGAVRAATTPPTIDVSTSLAPGFFLSGALLFAASKALKYWAMGALGTRWTFRVYVLPGLPLVESGPYQYVSHPNYIAVVGELAGTAMMMGARMTGPVVLAGFGLILALRIRFETRVHRVAYEKIDHA